MQVSETFLGFIFDLVDLFVSAFADLGNSISQPLFPVSVVEILDTIDEITSVFPNFSIGTLFKDIFGVVSWGDVSILHFLTAGLMGIIIFMFVKWIVGLLT